MSFFKWLKSLFSKEKKETKFPLPTPSVVITPEPVVVDTDCAEKQTSVPKTKKKIELKERAKTSTKKTEKPKKPKTTKKDKPVK
jgi:hypothetical protein